MFLVLVDLDWTKLRHVFLRGEVRITPVSEGDDPNRDQKDPENPGRLHVASLNAASTGDQINDQDDDGDH